MQLLISDIWGADGSAKIEMPGDNGNWTNYDNFLTALIDAINTNDISTSLDLEIWNEPDLTDVFWQRTQEQYLQMWGRGYARLRAAFPQNDITGPCLASSPYSTNAWYEAYLQFIKTNNTIPDTYCWHLESGSGDDIEVTIPAFNALLEKYALPTKPLVLNEYGVKTEQQPSGSSWYISRLERHGARGLRGNWGSNGALHDYFAGLLGKPNAGTSNYSSTQAGYWGNGEYNVYKYYYQNMTGQRVETIGSLDQLFDVYATKGHARNSVKILSGTRKAAGNWDILITGLSTVGLPSRGSVIVRSYQFNYTDGEFGNVPAPIDRGTTTHKYTKDQLLLHVSTDNTTAYAFEFA